MSKRKAVITCVQLFVALNVNVVFNVKVFMKKFNLLIPIIILLSGCSSVSPIEKESESESHF
ncbi:MAG: hypothetical protein ACI808_002466, partial [Paraglaciecola sp.]